MSRFEGATVLITGATGGLGSAAAKAFAAQGARLVLSDLDEAALGDFAATLDADTAILAGNIADEKLSEDLVKLAVQRFGRLDVAVNNAGIVHSFVRLPQVTSEEARRVLEVDLLGVFYAMKQQIPQMERQFKQRGKGGVIVNVASVAGLSGAPKLSVYAAAKHGVVGLTRSAAVEYATKGVRINAICPAHTRTAMVDGFIRSTGAPEDEALAELTRGVPMRRVGEVDEITAGILFLADPANSFMTGHALALDGGIGAI
ncbi:MULTISPECIES: glucose 1-dehydrogenase [unclassified Mesorhizobium]|uniref:SDR family NAD(P)-dependent oxidoreductase n=1 Tax=unclassified Mesorhizobium TaxID=325217 RepID=UPI000BB06D4E|nr:MULTISPECIES: glucose 1-dehydrogenase [unclassified Mesorhizobium]TGT56546.1 SDR family oxidoreductase [Mesorhizobium sp. M00.F.Ca.ET.170.01.1.1]AZO11605.1 glucose 1-dehydrogenase [Mesorhizobium sp. M3A.F.Ca.ET.080.04.2.1]PBB86775.1 oxidoreductase [Mesorhizobium sp. WSM3876]RWB72760.1 MAG: glucose 1-dehydrogenase [Mesorhizobium sp.]RWB86967.1 MAG: glucose 1-dehydrogenase [Mesorhizobium sp.]